MQDILDWMRGKSKDDFFDEARGINMEVVRKAVREEVEEVLSNSYVDSKTHFEHHVMLGKLLGMLDKMAEKSIGIFVVLMFVGFGFFTALFYFVINR